MVYNILKGTQFLVNSKMTEETPVSSAMSKHSVLSIEGAEFPGLTQGSVPLPNNVKLSQMIDSIANLLEKRHSTEQARSNSTARSRPKVVPARKK